MGECKPYKYSPGDIIKTTKTTWTVLGRKIFDTKPRYPKKHYLCKCHQCNASLWKSEIELSQGEQGAYGQGSCGICANRVVLTGYNDVATTHPQLVKYFKDPEDALLINSGSREKRWFKCPDCGFEIEKPVEYVVLHNSICCTQCSDNISYPNKLAFSVLRQLKAENLIAELKESWSENKRYDFSFYKNGVHYLLEMDGGFHYEERFGRDKDTIQHNDALKTRLALENDCILIRIECKKSELNYIRKRIENSLLAQLFDLSIIDWKQVETDCAKNILIDLVRYKINNPDITEYDLANEFNICKQTVVNYLKRANTIGLINYKTYTEQLNDRFLQIVEYKKAHMEATNTEIGKIMNVSAGTVRNHLIKAEKQGLIKIKSLNEIKKEKVQECIKTHVNLTNHAIGKLLGVSHDFVAKCRKELAYD